MRSKIKEAVSETVKDLIKGGVEVDYTEKELNQLGINIPDVKISSKDIKQIRKSSHYSQPVFAKMLNVSVSSVRQWEQGKKNPTGSTKVLLELLKNSPTILDYRLSFKKASKSKSRKPSNKLSTALS